MSQSSGPLSVRIVNRSQEIFHGSALYVSAPTSEGMLGVLPGRAPLLALLNAGEVLVRSAEQGEQRFAVGEGFLSIDQDHVTIVVDSL